MIIFKFSEVMFIYYTCVNIYRQQFHPSNVECDPQSAVASRALNYYYTRWVSGVARSFGVPGQTSYGAPPHDSLKNLVVNIKFRNKKCFVVIICKTVLQYL